MVWLASAFEAVYFILWLLVWKLEVLLFSLREFYLKRRKLLVTSVLA